MSTLSVNTITDASGGNTAKINTYTPTESNMMGKNRIINGDMRIDQRNAGASVTPTNASYTLDRYQSLASQTSKYTVEQTVTGVAAPTGFTDYLAVTSSSAYSVLTGDYFNVRQAIEGFNAADFGFGTANAKTVTLSFWVLSSLTGTFGGGIVNIDGTRSYPYTYTISSANTWEYKTITIPGDTTGTWNTNNAGWGFIQFGLGVGSTFSGTAGSWAGANYLSATGATSVVGTNGATWYITGVQLEVGSVATPFERRPFGTELALCQRYYQKPGNAIWRGNNSSATGNFYYWMPFATTMRAAPTMGVGTPTYSNASSATFFNASPAGAEFYLNVTSGGGYAQIAWTADIEL
jgi:hypothetical protein